MGGRCPFMFLGNAPAAIAVCIGLVGLMFGSVAYVRPSARPASRRVHGRVSPSFRQIRPPAMQ